MVRKEEFIKTVWKYYQDNKRDLPWRKTSDPYCIFVSEVMLQQTQAGRVIPKYLEFIKVFPTFDKLAKAPFTDIVTLWQGLGYNRRALFLKKAAEIIIEKYKGTFPKNTDEVSSLPGIGAATAAAIITYSYNIPKVFIETNIRTVFIYFFFRERTEVNDKNIIPLVKKTLDTKNPREWYWALMDYGAMLKKQKNFSRQSKHYIRQSPFQGSRRQLRGELLRLLIHHGPIPADKLDHNQKEIVDQMEKDGLVIVKNCLISLS